MADYNDKSLEELKEEARERDLKGRSALNKDELAKALEEDDAKSSGESSTAKKDSLGADSEASDEDNPEVVENLSPGGQEALDEMGDAAAEEADLALDASGPLHLQSPHERVMTGAVSEDHAKEQEETLKDLPDDHLGNVTEAGYAAPREARKGSGPNGEIMPEDVIDFPPPLQPDENADEGNGNEQQRAFDQDAQVQTDGLSGEADHNVERAMDLDVGEDEVESKDEE